MNRFWTVFWGRTSLPPVALSGIHYLGIVVVLLILGGFCAFPGSNLLIRTIVFLMLAAPLWLYWMFQVKRMAGPANLLVPQLRQRLLVMSMGIWTFVVSLVALGATIWHGGEHFLLVWLAIGSAALLVSHFDMNQMSLIEAVLFGAVVMAGIAMTTLAGWISPYWQQHLDMLALPFCLLLPWLAWLRLSALLRNGAIRRRPARQPRRRLNFAEFLHQWFLNRMTKECENPAINGEKADRVRLESRLNFCFGPAFHWTTFFVELRGFWWVPILLLADKLTDYSIIGVFANLGNSWFFMLVIFILPNARSVAQSQMKAIVFGRVSNTASYWIDGKDGTLKIDHRAQGQGNAGLMQGLLFLAPGLPQGKALSRAWARICLHYFAMLWICTMVLYGVLLTLLPTTVHYHGLILLAFAELAMAGFWVRGCADSNYANSRSFARLAGPNTFLEPVWLLLIFAPDWLLQSVSLPLWISACALGGTAFFIKRWRCMCDAPVLALPEQLLDAEIPGGGLLSWLLVPLLAASFNILNTASHKLRKA